ncbi:MAG: hypothetical protein WCB36_03680 [Burkholderiales bacterium]
MKAPKMNHAEDKILDEYLAGKSHLSASYKSIGMDLPGIEVDSAILAASRREVHARPYASGTNGWRKWQIPFSIAAVLVVSASLTLTMVDYQKNADQASLAPAPMIVAEESKTSRGDSLEPPKSVDIQADELPAAAAPPRVRKLEPVERNKQKMLPVPSPDGKAAKADSAARDSAKPASPSLESRTGAEPPSTIPQSFPATAQGRRSVEPAAEINMPAQSELSRIDKTENVARKEGGPASVTRLPNGDNTVGERPRIATASAPSAAPAKGTVMADSIQPPPARPSASAAKKSVAADATTDNRRNSVTAQEEMRKSGQLGDSATVAAYGAAQTLLAKIEALLREGKTEEAERNLAEFKNRFPNYVTPESITEELSKQRAALNAEPK